MSWESWIDLQIRVAQEQGAFDNLPGAGKPLPDHGQPYDPMWWVKHLRSASDSPCCRRRSSWRARWRRSSPPSTSCLTRATVRRRIDALNVEIARLNATAVEGPPTRLYKLDVDQVVARWRRTRTATPQ